MSTDSDPVAALARLKAARVLCVGDVTLDQTISGTLGANRRGEPVLVIDRQTRQVGRAGRVLRDLAALGVGASFVSVVGNDDAGREIGRLLAAEAGTEVHLLVQPDRTTATRSRYAAGDRRLLRADRDDATPLGPYVRDDLLRVACELATTHGAVVISDHGRGVLTEGVALEIIKAAHEAGARTVVDAEGGDPIRYRGADLLTATRGELAQGTGMAADDEADIVAAAAALINRCALGAVLVTQRGEGALLVKPDDLIYFEAADDPGVAMLAAALAAGMPLREALQLAATDGRLVSGAGA